MDGERNPLKNTQAETVSRHWRCCLIGVEKSQISLRLWRACRNGGTMCPTGVNEVERWGGVLLVRGRRRWRNKISTWLLFLRVCLHDLPTRASYLVRKRQRRCLHASIDFAGTSLYEKNRPTVWRFHSTSPSLLVTLRNSGFKYPS